MNGRLQVRGSVRAWALTLLGSAAATFMTVLLVGPVSFGAGSSMPTAQRPLAVPGKPSIPEGGAGFVSHCAGCHADRSPFEAPAWRKDTTPATVARMALGEVGGHPAAVSNLTEAWDVTGYLWTLPDSGGDIRRGESLALQADDALRADALGTLLFHWNAIQNLKSASWVLNHTEVDVDRLMREVGGSRYAGLSPGDRQDLIDYTFASFFVWPSSW